VGLKNEKGKKERKRKKGKRKTNKHTPKLRDSFLFVAFESNPSLYYYKRAFLWSGSKSKARGIALRVLTFKRHLTFFFFSIFFILVFSNSAFSLIFWYSTTVHRWLIFIDVLQMRIAVQVHYASFFFSSSDSDSDSECCFLLESFRFVLFHRFI